MEFSAQSGADAPGRHDRAQEHQVSGSPRPGFHARSFRKQYYQRLVLPGKSGAIGPGRGAAAVTTHAPSDIRSFVVSTRAAGIAADAR